MSVAEATPPESATPGRQRSLGPRLDRGERIRLAIIAALLIFTVFVLPGMLSAYWTDIATAVAVFSIVALGLGLLMGRVGLVSLGQIAVLALGAWVAARLDFAHVAAVPDRAALDRA